MCSCFAMGGRLVFEEDNRGRECSVENLANQTPDRELMERFLRQRDESAFEALVRHHGARVFKVAQRVLHHEHEAEDVFQATFLTRARTAGSPRKPGSVACWLHGVAQRLALQSATPG
jgi:DNA-directed RNA polymerase specialized sigma24 family protein